MSDLGEITVDVIGFPDDAQLGERLHVFAEPDPGGESFTVRSVESTTTTGPGRRPCAFIVSRWATASSTQVQWMTCNPCFSSMRRVASATTRLSSTYSTSPPGSDSGAT